MGTTIRHCFFTRGHGVPSGDVMRVVTICMPESYIEGVDRLIERGMYPNRSEVIRIAIRDLLLEELWGTDRRVRSLPVASADSGAPIGVHHRLGQRPLPSCTGQRD